MAFLTSSSSSQRASPPLCRCRLRKDAGETALLIPCTVLPQYWVVLCFEWSETSISVGFRHLWAFSMRCAVKISYRAGLSAFLACKCPPVRISACRWHSQRTVKAFSSANGKQSWCFQSKLTKHCLGVKWSRSGSWLSRCPLGVLTPLPKPTLFKVTQKNNPSIFFIFLIFFKCKAGRSVL